MEMSESITELAVALAKAQAMIEGAEKGKTNPAFKSKYADLSSVWNACREALTTNGLSVVQAPGAMIENRMTLTTVLLHSSGQWMRETLSIPLTKADAQGYGSATTYARRYALAAFVGVSPEDDDGNAASVVSRGANDRGNGSADLVNADQLARLQGEADAAQADVMKFCKFMGVSSLKQIPASEYQRAFDALASKRKAAA